MILKIAYVVVFFVEMLISYILFNNIFERKTSLKSTAIIGIVFFEFGAVVNICFFSTVWLNCLISFLANVLFSNVCFKTKKSKSIFYSILLVSLSSLLELISVLIISSFSQLNVSNYESQTIILISEVMISKIIYFFLITFLLRFIKYDISSLRVPLGFYFYPATALISMICFWYISIQETLTYKTQIIIAFICIMLFLASIVVFFAFQHSIQKENELLLIQQEQDKIQTDITYYDILEKQNKDLRIYAHDAKNHLSAIKNLNNNPEIERHISKMIESLAKYSKVCHSGNHTLDVIIDKYVTECELNNIIFEFDIKNNNLSQIEPYDLVGILGNLLDNAIEATEKSKDKTVRIESDFRNNFSVIIVSNSCVNTPKLDNSKLPSTTKNNKRLHGFGLKSVQKTVKKYNGDISFDYDYETKTFLVTIMIGNK